MLLMDFTCLSWFTIMRGGRSSARLAPSKSQSLRLDLFRRKSRKDCDYSGVAVCLLAQLLLRRRHISSIKADHFASTDAREASPAAWSQHSATRCLLAFKPLTRHTRAAYKSSSSRESIRRPRFFLRKAAASRISFAPISRSVEPARAADSISTSSRIDCLAANWTQACKASWPTTP